MESEDVAKMHRAQTSNFGGRQRKNTSYGRSSSYEKRWCYFCEEIKNGSEKSHNTRDCMLRNNNRKKAKNFKVEVEDDQSEKEESNEDSDKLEEMLQEMNNQQ